MTRQVLYSAYHRTITNRLCIETRTNTGYPSYHVHNDFVLKQGRIQDTRVKHAHNELVLKQGRIQDTRD
jgi:hypothetical protein